jgi:hypothetical protein
MRKKLLHPVGINCATGLLWSGVDVIENSCSVCTGMDFIANGELVLPQDRCELDSEQRTPDLSGPV